LTFSILSEKSHHFLNIIEKRETLIIISHVILVTLDFNKFLPNYNHKYENVGMPLFIKTLCGFYGGRHIREYIRFVLMYQYQRSQFHSAVNDFLKICIML